MGRWGHRLFQGDQDKEFLISTHESIQTQLETLGVIVPDKQLADMLLPEKSNNFRSKPSSYTTEQVREYLNSFSDELFDYQRAHPDFFSDGFNSIILGALLMHAGVNISEANRSHLRLLAQRVHSSPGNQGPFNDAGFRDPGKVQFLAALEHYEDGKPRDITVDSCFNCGRINGDIEPASLRACARCTGAWYCHQECEKENEKDHKLICKVPSAGPGIGVFSSGNGGGLVLGRPNV